MLLAFGDTHKSKSSLKYIAGLINQESPQIFVHTGDNYSDFLHLKRATGIEGLGVKGNCDFGVDAEDDIIFDYMGKKILLTHGHNYSVKSSTRLILEEAKLQDLDAVIFGHTHVQLAEKVEGIWLINPGSIPQPRGGSESGYCKIYLEHEELGVKLVNI